RRSRQPANDSPRKPRSGPFAELHDDARGCASGSPPSRPAISTETTANRFGASSKNVDYRQSRRSAPARAAASWHSLDRHPTVPASGSLRKSRQTSSILLLALHRVPTRTLPPHGKARSGSIRDASDASRG